MLFCCSCSGVHVSSMWLAWLLHKANTEKGCMQLSGVLTDHEHTLMWTRPPDGNGGRFGKKHDVMNTIMSGIWSECYSFVVVFFFWVTSIALNGFGCYSVSLWNSKNALYSFPPTLSLRWEENLLLFSPFRTRLHDNVFGGRRKTLAAFWLPISTRTAFAFPENGTIQKKGSRV